MLRCNTVQLDLEVLLVSDLLSLLRTLAMHKLIEANTILQKIVNATHYTEHAEREDPNPDHCNNAGLAADEPAEDTEHGCYDVNNQNGGRELP